MASVAGVGAFVLLAGPGGYRPADLDFGTPAAQRRRGDAAASGGLRRYRCQGETRGHFGTREDPRHRRAGSVAAQRQRRRSHSVRAGLADAEILPAIRRSERARWRRNAPQAHRTIIGEGSGFFISADGYAVTNNHVVDHAKSVQVTTADGTIYKAKVVGTDPKTDLALIKVDGKSDFPFVKFADHAPHVGDWVIAVGNPFGLGGTVTAGIVSASSRDIGAGPYDDYIQIDAPINKGNSGGPAFDVERQCDRHQHRDLLAVRRLGRHRLRYPGANRETGHGAAEGSRLGDPRLARRADPAGQRRHRRQPRHEEGRGRHRRQRAARQSRRSKPACSPVTSSPRSTARR